VPLPIQLEKDKAAALSKVMQGRDDIPEEAIWALRQNLAQPGKIIVVTAT
jgi:hypothetical protein